MYLINRYYDPSLRQFISVDPAYSQTHQLYGYANENPVNGSDPSGLITCPSWVPGCGVVTDIQNGVSATGKEVAHLAIDAVTDPFYLLYWGSFEGAAKLDKFGCSLGEAGCVVAHILSLAFVQGEVVGIGVDAGGDWLKKSVLGLDYPCGTHDEGLPNQWLLGSQAGPKLSQWFGWNWKVTFPGIRPSGSFDFQW